MLPEVLDAMLPWLRDGHANPSGAYASARKAKDAIELARQQVATWLNAEVDEIVFTSGGTESVNTALYSLDQLVGQGNVLISAIEHSAVMRSAEALNRPVLYAPVDANGRLNLSQFESLLHGTAMISVMTANNETGVIQPIQEICKMARSRGIPVHSDAVQAAGKMPIHVKQLGVDSLSISAHKFHGPKGIGALYTRRGIRFSPFLKGGTQEYGRRAGTENIPGIVGMGAAAFAMHTTHRDQHALRSMRDHFENTLLTQLQGVSVNGSVQERLPNTSHLSFAACEAVDLIQLLDRAGIECSAGSACMSGKIRPSHVQLAMGIDGARGRGSLRFSFSKLNTMEDSLRAATIVQNAVEQLRTANQSGVFIGLRPTQCSLSYESND